MYDKMNLFTFMKCLKKFAKLLILSIVLISVPALANEPINYILQEKPLIDFTIIKESCGIKMPIDSAELKEQKTEDLETIYDDYNYYTSGVLEFLEKEKVKIVSAKTRYLIFVLQDKSEIYIDTKSLNWHWIFFNPKTAPKVFFPIDLAVDDKEFKDFF